MSLGFSGEDFAKKVRVRVREGRVSLGVRINLRLGLWLRVGNG